MLDHINTQSSIDPLALIAGMGQQLSLNDEPSLQSTSEVLLDLLSRRTISQDERYAILAAFVAATYVRGNPLAADDLVGLVGALKQVLSGAPSQQALQPAVPIAQSVTGSHIICLEDGHACKSLQRYLKRRFNMSPHAYRQRWGLPADYPMVAPEYSRCRAALARAQQLGQYERKKAAS